MKTEGQIHQKFCAICKHPASLHDGQDGECTAPSDHDEIYAGPELGMMPRMCICSTFREQMDSPEPWGTPLHVDEQEWSYFIVSDDIAVAEVFGKSEDTKRIAYTMAYSAELVTEPLLSAAKAVVDHWIGGNYQVGLEKRLIDAVKVALAKKDGQHG